MINRIKARRKERALRKYMANVEKIAGRFDKLQQVTAQKIIKTN